MKYHLPDTTVSLSDRQVAELEEIVIQNSVMLKALAVTLKGEMWTVRQIVYQLMETRYTWLQSLVTEQICKLPRNIDIANKKKVQLVRATYGYFSETICHRKIDKIMRDSAKPYATKVITSALNYILRKHDITP